MIVKPDVVAAALTASPLSNNCELLRPSNPDPSPLNDVAVQTPVIETPAPVVLNFQYQKKKVLH